MKAAKAVPVLMYHHVSPSPGLVTISPENFRAQMHWLAENGYTTIGCDDLAAFLAGRQLTAKSVLLTFDDGYLDNYVHAHPVLAEFGLKASLFLVTGNIGAGSARACTSRGTVPETPSHTACKDAIRNGHADAVMLRWSEIDYMRNAGTFEFHSHTHTHTRWDKVETDLSARNAKLADDLMQSRATLFERLGQTTPHLCWPQGYYDNAYRSAARVVGFTNFYTVKRGTCLRDTAAEEIPRIVVKDQPGDWLGRRLQIYGAPWLARLYTALHR